VIIGPDRLPAYAAKLALFLTALRRMADGAKDRMRDEMGPDFDDVDWQKLDPRQYDPRRIIREALTEDLFDSPMDTTATESASAKRAVTVDAGKPAPFDDEAT